MYGSQPDAAAAEEVIEEEGMKTARSPRLSLSRSEEGMLQHTGASRGMESSRKELSESARIGESGVFAKEATPRDQGELADMQCNLASLLLASKKEHSEEDGRPRSHRASSRSSVHAYRQPDSDDEF